MQIRSLVFSLLSSCREKLILLNNKVNDLLPLPHSPNLRGKRIESNRLIPIRYIIYISTRILCMQISSSLIARVLLFPLFEPRKGYFTSLLLIEETHATTISLLTMTGNNGQSAKVPGVFISLSFRQQHCAHFGLVYEITRKISPPLSIKRISNNNSLLAQLKRGMLQICNSSQLQLQFLPPVEYYSSQEKNKKKYAEK